ncbi:hypothetical protein L596_001379 [Steinernema carpocapsae]|uniref:Epidermal growth factor receptor substrate 15-like 1 n=1 Tax=Steinernema carpocapsae TaxID=34508 RepID=A0A4U8UN43_STECR|nr:hypothetical protein L596_001379 [Steinernema carpocapsae]
MACSSNASERDPRTSRWSFRVPDRVPSSSFASVVVAISGSRPAGERTKKKTTTGERERGNAWTDERGEPPGEGEERFSASEELQLKWVVYRFWIHAWTSLAVPQPREFSAKAADRPPDEVGKRAEIHHFPAVPPPPIFGLHAMELATIWSILPTDEAKYEAIFNSLNPNMDGKLTGEQVRPVLLNSNLPPAVLASIWELSDVDKDGCLGKREMCIALHLVYKCLQNVPIPSTLPHSLATYFRDGQRLQTSSSLSADREVGTALAASEMNQINQSHSVPIASGSRSSSVTGDWPLNPIVYKAQFESCDSDHDGFATGVDLRNFLLSSGVAQNDLAQIWELADIKKNGAMNLEQFTLLMYLLDERKKGRPLYPSLPPHLVPPTMRAASRPSTTELSPHSNETLDKLNSEIETLAKERNSIENHLIQLDADMTIKNSEIKNLQLELNTLEKTADQLSRQKVEAGKRLNDLDHQLTVQETAVTEQMEKLTAEEARLHRTKEAIAESHKNVEAEREALTIDRQKLASIENQKQSRQGELEHRRRAMEQVTNELSDTDGDIKKWNAKISQLDAAKEHLSSILKELRETVNKEDIGDVNHLLCDFRATILPNSVSPVSQQPPQMQPHPVMTKTSSTDPFGGDPFASSKVDPFGSKSFGDPFKNNDDPFSSSDPFGSNAQSSDDFANFANFQ